MSKSGTTRRKGAQPGDIQKYEKAWADMMVKIWREKIQRLHVLDTYSLHNNITGNVDVSSAATTIQHKFTTYGIFQDCGTGRGFKKKNGGNLDILDPVYRAEHGMQGEPRKPREWFSRAYFASVMVLKEQEAYIYGEEFAAILVERIEETNDKRSKSMRSHLWG